MKEARTGGKFVWHQDYGYWYNFACMFPDMLTVFIAMDPCSPDNGCLQVLRGSHRAGRIDHGGVGNQVSGVLLTMDVCQSGEWCFIDHVGVGNQVIGVLLTMEVLVIK